LAKFDAIGQKLKYQGDETTVKAQTDIDTILFSFNGKCNFVVA